MHLMKVRQNPHHQGLQVDERGTDEACGVLSQPVALSKTGYEVCRDGNLHPFFGFNDPPCRIRVELHSCKR